ncbi:MAG: hypothetical protein HXY35_04775 [Chloroflexi bacterium]|nr:hypothetical protein [Chloroflexota bacterium]
MGLRDEVNVTVVAFVLSVLLGIGSLVIGYSQAGFADPVRWFVVLGFLWLAAHWQRWHWFSPVALLLAVAAAAYGVWKEFRTVWMILGALGGLLGWDLFDFARRLRYAAPTDDIRGMERRHLERVAVVVILGLVLALLSVYVRIQRLAFEVAVGLILLAALGLTRLVIGLRKY